jgi:inorganic pyrophosphatase
MNIDAIAIGKNPPDDLNVIIEVPIGGEPIKYEIDKASGALFVDRFLYTPMRYPGNYGFVPHTLCGDGDPLDVIVMNSRPLVPGAVVRCRPVRRACTWKTMAARTKRSSPCRSPS